MLDDNKQPICIDPHRTYTDGREGRSPPSLTVQDLIRQTGRGLFLRMWKGGPRRLTGKRAVACGRLC